MRIPPDSFVNLGEPPPNTAHAFIQWQGTDVCMDFTCECGEGEHIDGTHKYEFACHACGRIWEMPQRLFPRLIGATSTCS